MKHDKGLQQLIALARRGRDSSAPQAPFGFAARVSAQAFQAQETPGLLTIWQRVGKWAVACALAACVATVVLHPRQRDDSALAEFAGLNTAGEETW